MSTVQSIDWDRLVRPALIGADAHDPGATTAEIARRYGVADLLKLNWNEDPSGPLPGVADAARDAVDHAWSYPDEAYRLLRERLAERLGTPLERIVLAHGIQALVNAIVGIFVQAGEAVVLPAPTYGLYSTVCAAAGARGIVVPCVGDRLDLAGMAAAANEASAKLVWICDPNNPTGATIEPEEWAAFRAALEPGCVIVADEAYGDYVDPTRAIDRVGEVASGAPMVVLRTFSKIYGMAGLRLGYAVVDEGLAHHFNVELEPFNVNCVALAAGLASLARHPEVDARRIAAAASRRTLTDALEAEGMRAVPSQANFVMLYCDVDDVLLVDRAARRGVLIRPGSDFGRPEALRITIGSADVTARAVDAVRAAYREVRDRTP